MKKARRSNIFIRRKDIFDFDMLADEWLENVRPQVKESTYTRYQRIVRKYLEPAFKAFYANVRDSRELTRLTEYLLRNGGTGGGELSPKTVTDILCVLKSVLKFGQRHKYPCPSADEIKYPQKTLRRPRIFDEAGRKKLERIVLSSDSIVSIGIAIALFTGIRIGELCGLKWGDFDFVNRTVYISRTVERIADLDPGNPRKTKIIIGSPKTNNSARIIPLPSFISEYLIRFRKNDNAYVLTGGADPMEPHCFYLAFQRFLKEYGFRPMPFHALRHTFATRCVELGFDTKALSEILGHSNVSTTLDIYVHPTMSQKREQMERLSLEVKHLK